VVRAGAASEKDRSRARALRSFVWFLASVSIVLVVFGVIFPDVIWHLRQTGRSGGEAAVLLLDLGLTLRGDMGAALREGWDWGIPTYVGVGLLPMLAATVLLVSRMERALVHRILYTCSAVLGLALIAGSISLFLAFFNP
jgi:hypothetical protein